MAKNYKTVLNARSVTEDTSSSTSSYPPGYYAGGNPTINTNGNVVINGIACDVNGQAVRIKDSTEITGENWIVSKINNGWYYIYIDASGTFYVDCLEPVYSEDLIGYYNQTYDWRYVAKFFRNLTGSVTTVVGPETEAQFLDVSEGSFGGIVTSVIYNNTEGKKFLGTDTFQNIIDWIDDLLTATPSLQNTTGGGTSLFKCTGIFVDENSVTYSLKTIQYTLSEVKIIIDYDANGDYGSSGYCDGEYADALEDTTHVVPNYLYIYKLWRETISSSSILPVSYSTPDIGSFGHPFSKMVMHTLQARSYYLGNVGNLGPEHSFGWYVGPDMTYSADIMMGVWFYNTTGTSDDLFNKLETYVGLGKAKAGDVFHLSAKGFAVGGAAFQYLTGVSYGSGYYTLTWSTYGSNLHMFFNKAVKVSSTIWHLYGYYPFATQLNRILRLVAQESNSTNAIQSLVHGL